MTPTMTHVCANCYQGEPWQIVDRRHYRHLDCAPMHGVEQEVE